MLGHAQCAGGVHVSPAEDCYGSPDQASSLGYQASEPSHGAHETEHLIPGSQVLRRTESLPPPPLLPLSLPISLFSWRLSMPV